MINAKIVADSINPNGARLTSWELDYPLFIHAELMTHREFSRNASSARAIPFDTYLSSIETNPAFTVKPAGHQKGMQVGEDLSLEEIRELQEESLHLLQLASNSASYAHDILGVHKSIVNRWLLPWAHIKVLVTCQNHDNFFSLRAHSDAEPNFQVLAFKMLQAYLTHEPHRMQWGDWHLPFENNATDYGLTIEEKKKLSVARACWVSYNKPGKEVTSFSNAFHRHDSAADSGHWSPFEHVAQATPGWYKASNFDRFDAPLCGWKQYRKDFLEEYKSPANLDEILAHVPEWIQPHLK